MDCDGHFLEDSVGGDSGTHIPRAKGQLFSGVQNLQDPDPDDSWGRWGKKEETVMQLERDSGICGNEQ